MLAVVVLPFVAGEAVCGWPSASGDKYLSVVPLEERLLNESVYDKTVRPSVAMAGTLEAPADRVVLQMYLTSFQIDELGQELVARGVIRLIWDDFRLAYSAARECEDPQPWVVTEKSTGLLWRPSLYAENEILSDRVARYYEGSATAVYPNGTVVDEFKIDGSYECSFQAKRLPFDRHVCQIVISSFRLNVNQLDIVPDSPAIDTSDVKDNNVWYLRSVSSTATHAARFFVPRPVLELEFHITRRSGYHLLFSMMPGCLFLLTGYCGFFILRTQAPARVTIAIIPVLIMRLLLNRVYDSLESVSYRIYLAQFLNIALYISVSCVAEYSIVQYLLHLEALAAERRTSLKLMAARITQVQSEKDNAPLPTEDEKKAPPSAPDEVCVDIQDDDHTHGRQRHRRFSRGFEQALSDQRSSKKTSSIRGRLHESAKAFAHMKTHDDDNQDDDGFEPAGFNPVFTRDLDHLREIFDKFDDDASGFIEAQELANVLRYYGVYVDETGARDTILNYYYSNHMPIPKKRSNVQLSFDQCVDFLVRYDDYAIESHPREFFAFPRSLQLDVVCRKTYIPAVTIIFFVHWIAWFGI